MCRLLAVVLGVGSFLALAGGALADDAGQAILDKAVKAHGGADKLNKIQAMRLKTKGKLHLMGGLPFNQEVAIAANGKFRESLNLEAGGQKFDVVTVYDGDKAWVNAAGTTQELKDDILKEVKEAGNLIAVFRLTNLKDKKFELSPLGEIKVQDKPAVGVKVTAKGMRDLDLYFDKKTDLLVKVQRRAFDATTMKEVTEDRFITDYQDVDGMKVGKKVVVHHDGKEFMEAEVLDFKLVDKLEDSEFAKP